MPWNAETKRDGVHLALTGQVDIFEAAPLHKVLVELTGRAGSAHVDLSKCADLDSSALQLLVAFRQAHAAGGGRVSFTGASGRVSRLLERFRLQGILGEPTHSPI